jgi:phasin family protein
LKIDQSLVSAVNNTSLGLALAVAEAAYAAADRLAGLQLESGKALLQESFDHARKMAAAKDLVEVAGMFTAWTQGNVAKLSGYSRNYVAIAQDTGNQMLKYLDDEGAQLQRQMLETIEKSALHAPVPGGEWWTAGTKTAVTATTAVMDAVQQAVTQLTEFAGAGLKPVPISAAVASVVPRAKRVA